MRRITVTHSTIGQASASPVTLSGGYRYRGDPDWTPGDARYREPGSAANRMAAGSGGAVNTERRQERLREFTAALADLGHPDPVQAPNPAVIEAGERVGVGEKTAKSYRTEIKQQRRREQAAAAPAEDAEPGEIVAGIHAEIAGFSPRHAALVAGFERRQATRGAQQP